MRAFPERATILCEHPLVRDRIWLWWGAAALGDLIWGGLLGSKLFTLLTSP